MSIVAPLSDLHGIRSRFEKARRLIDDGIKTLLMAGDIARNDPAVLNGVIADIASRSLRRFTL